MFLDLRQYPHLLQEWHPTKNERLNPVALNYKSRDLFWWRCAKGHEWQMVIYKRVKRKFGCPYCSNHSLLVGYNDLATLAPQLASEWHPTKNDGLLPENVLSGSRQTVWWQCKNGHEWQSTVGNRLHQHTQCPYCIGHRMLTGYSDFATRFPEYAAEWHPTKNGDLLPSQIPISYSKSVWWQCKNGHEWTQIPYTRVHENTACPFCTKSSKRATPKRKVKRIRKSEWTDLEILTIAEMEEWEFDRLVEDLRHTYYVKQD